MIDLFEKRVEYKGKDAYSIAELIEQTGRSQNTILDGLRRGMASGEVEQVWKKTGPHWTKVYRRKK